MQLVTMVERRNAAVRAVLHAGWSIGRRHLLATAAPDRPDLASLAGRSIGGWTAGSPTNPTEAHSAGFTPTLRSSELSTILDLDWTLISPPNADCKADRSGGKVDGPDI